MQSTCSFDCCYGAVLSRRRPHHVLILSVCLSVCPVPPPRGKTKRPTNTKLGRNGPWDTSTPWTNFKVKGSEVKVTAANCIVGEKQHNAHSNAGWQCTSVCPSDKFLPSSARTKRPRKPQNSTHVLNCKNGPIAGGPSTAAPSCLEMEFEQICCEWESQTFRN